MVDFPVVQLHGNAQRDYGVLTPSNKCNIWLDRFVLCIGTTSPTDNPTTFSGTKIYGSSVRWRSCGLRFGGQMSVIYGDTMNPWFITEFRICKAGKGYAFINSSGIAAPPNSFTFWFNSGSYGNPRWNFIRAVSAGADINYNHEVRIKFGETRKNTNVVELDCCFDCTYCGCVQCNIIGRFRFSYGWGNAYKPYDWTWMVNTVTSNEPIDLGWLSGNGVPIYGGGAWGSTLVQGSDATGQLNGDYVFYTHYGNLNIATEAFLFKVEFKLTETQIQFGTVSWGKHFLNYPGWDSGYGTIYDEWLYSFVAYVEDNGTPWALGYHKMGYQGAVAPTCRSNRTYPFNFMKNCVTHTLTCCDRITAQPLTAFALGKSSVKLSYNGTDIIAPFIVENPNGLGFEGRLLLQQGMSGNRDWCRNEIYVNAGDELSILLANITNSGVVTWGFSGTVCYIGAAAYWDVTVILDVEVNLTLAHYYYDGHDQYADTGTPVAYAGMEMFMYIMHADEWDILGSRLVMVSDGAGIFRGTMQRSQEDSSGRTFARSGRPGVIYIWKINGCSQRVFAHTKILGRRFLNCRGEEINANSYDCIRRYDNDTDTNAGPIPYTFTFQ